MAPAGLERRDDAIGEVPAVGDAVAEGSEAAIDVDASKLVTAELLVGLEDTEAAETTAVPFKASKGAASFGLLLKYAPVRSPAVHPELQGLDLQQPQNGGVASRQVQNSPASHS